LDALGAEELLLLLLPLFRLLPKKLKFPVSGRRFPAVGCFPTTC